MVDRRRSAHGDRRAPSVRAVGELPRGLHEALVTEGLRDRLAALPDPDTADRRALTAAEAADRIAWHVSREIERSLADVRDEDRPEVGVAVARSLLQRLGELVDADPAALPIDPGTVLAAVLGRRIDGSLQRAVAGGKIDETERAEIADRVVLGTGLDVVEGADLVIEAVPENADLKARILREASDAVSEDALIASNTSSIPIAQLAAFVPNPERVLGLPRDPS